MLSISTDTGQYFLYRHTGPKFGSYCHWKGRVGGETIVIPDLLSMDYLYTLSTFKDFLV